MTDISRLRRPLRAIAAGGAVLALLAGPTTAAIAAPAAPAGTGNSATVTLVHGVRGLLADVVVDGKTILKGFAYERASAPLQLSAGTYHIQVFKAGQPHTTALLDVHLTVKAGQQLSAAVGFDAKGNPKAYVFDDRLAATVHSAASIVVRNVSQGSAPTVVIDGKALGGHLAAGAQVIKGLSPGQHTVGLKVGSTWLLTSQPVQATAGKAMAVYVVGRQSAKSVALVADPITPTAATEASSVDTGGVAPTAHPGLLPAPVSLGLVGLGLAGVVALSRRRRPVHV